jgi:putative membrane protein
MLRRLYPLALAAALLSATACQKTADASTTADASVVENTSSDATDGTANSSANPDMLPAATATADAQAAGDADFLMKAGSGGMMEVEAAKLAQTKSSDAMVKSVADMILKDHTKANDELKALAASKNIKLPPAPTGEAKTTLDKLQAASGKEFDALYLNEMNTAHAKDIAMFEKQSQSAKDDDVRAFAAKTLPALQAHGEMIKKHLKMM